MTAEVSEWLKIMLEEIARKKTEAEQMLVEERRRRGEPHSCDPGANGEVSERGAGAGG